MDAPIISPSYSVFDSGPQAVTITSDDPSASIFFTTDGSVPDSGSTEYTGGFDISVSTLINAIAIDADISSPVATSYIQIDSSTTDVPRDGLIIWLKGDNGVITSSSNVLDWIDVSGSGNSPSQSDSSYQPSYVTDAVNDLPAVDFSGSGQFLQFPSGLADFTAGASIFVVIEPTGYTGEYERIFDFGNGTNDASSIVLWEPTSTSFAFSVFNADSDQTNVTSSAFTQDVYQLIEVIQDGSTTATLFTNSIQGAQNTAMLAIVNATRTGAYLGRYTAGSELFFEGQIAELIIYSRGLTDSERQAVEVYLSVRYGLPGAAPTISPSYSVFASGPQAVTITSVDSGATLFYTTNGAEPDSGSTEYTGSFDISSSTVVKAIGIDAGVSSAIATAYIQIDSTTSAVPRDGLLVWLKADNGVITSSSNVVDWIDVSGGGNDASQTVSGSQPTYVSDAINDLPAVDFNGSGQFLQFPSGFADFTSGISIFVILEPTGFTGEYARIIDLGDNTDDASSVVLWEPTSTSCAFSVVAADASQTNVISSDFTQEVYQMIELVFDGSATATMYTNGIEGAQNTSMFSIDNVTRTGNYIGRYTGGSELYLEGQIAELIIYSRGVIESERQAIEVYLADRFGLGLPGTAPTITPAYGVFASTQTVTITSTDPDATLRFTIDGSTPDSGSPEYTGSFEVSTSTTVKAIGIDAGVSTAVATAFIQIDATTANIARDGLLVWLKADNGITTSSSNVSAWMDMSGNENSATQSNHANQPSFVTGAINGLPAVDFSGSAQFLQFPPGFSDFTSGISILLVLKPTGDTGDFARILDFGDNTDDVFSIVLWEPTSTSFAFSVFNSTSEQTNIISSYFTQEAAQLIEVIQNASAVAALYTDGFQNAQNSWMTPIEVTTRSGNYLGRDTAASQYFFEGQMAELFIYSRDLSYTERCAIEIYAAARYGLTVPVPDSPLITLPGGSLAEPSQVAICGAYNGTVHFTTTGATPSPTDTIYSGPLDIYFSQTIKAIDVVAGAVSDVSSAIYTLDSTAYPAPSSDDTSPLAVDLDLPTSAQ